jgi:parallel beta-helix repeat protein
VDGRTIPHTENLTITKAITLIGADSDTALLEGGIAISGVDNVVLTGFTIQNTDPAVQILGDAAADTGAYLVNMTLKDCANGILISDDPARGGAAGAATRAILEKVSFVITQDMGVGYGVRVEELQDAGDEAQINNTTLFQTGDVGAVVIQGSQNVTVTGCSLSSANSAGVLVRDGNAVSSNVTVNNNAIQINFGHGIKVEGSSAVTIDRNTLSGNGGNGIDVDDTAAVTVTDNFIALNNEYGISSNSTVTVMNSGNFVSNNKIDSYNGNVDQQSETPAAEVGATSIGLITRESAAWIENAKGGTVAVIDSPNVLVDPLGSLFGASITVQPGSMTSDTVVTVAQSQEALPALPITFDIAMPVVQISLNSASLINNSTATITLPVLASFDPSTARVFRLVNNNSWEEITPLTLLRHLDTEPSLHQRVSFESDINQTATFELVIALPLINLVDDSSSGCGIQMHKHPSGDEINLPDMFLVFLPALILFLKRLKQRAVG